MCARCRRAGRGARGPGGYVRLQGQGVGTEREPAGLTRLRVAASRNEFREVWVTHEDRLTRFGLGFLRAELAGYGVSIHVLHEREDAALGHLASTQWPVGADNGR
jgi:hypothetical protein